jgi:hypothetical protein
VFDYSKITEKSSVITDYWKNNLLELILRKENLNKAYKQVKSNKGGGGIDGMQVDELLPYLRENQEILIQEIRLLREQMAVMMYRYAKEFKGYDVSGNAYYIRFTDAPSVSEYAKEAMAWAVGKGIITGKDLD